MTKIRMDYLVTVSRGGTDSQSIPCVGVEAARTAANDAWSDITTTLVIIANRTTGVTTKWDRRPKPFRKRYR